MKDQEYALYLKEKYGSNKTVTIVYQENKPDSIGNTLTLDQEYYMTLGELEPPKELSFVPEESGTYIFESVDVAYGNLYFQVFEGEDRIAYGNDCVQAALEKDEVYHLLVEYHSEHYEEREVSRSVSVRVVKMKKQAAVLEHMELLNKEDNRYADNEVYGVGGEEELGELLGELWLEKWYDYGKANIVSSPYLNGMTVLPDGSYSFEDDHGIEYVLTMTPTASVNGTTTYEVVISSGSVSTKAYLKITSEESVPTAVEGQESQISLAGGAKPGRKFWKFVPSETGYYDVKVAGSLGIPSRISVMPSVPNYFPYERIQGGWSLDQGVEYYIGVDYYTTQAGTVSVTVTRSEEKELADVELVSGPAYPFALDEVAAPNGEGAVFNLIYTDGTQKYVMYTDSSNSYQDGIWTDGCRVSDKKYRIVYTLKDDNEKASYCVTTYVPYIPWESLPLLKAGVFEEKFAEKNAELGINSYETKGFRFQPSKDGEYNFLTEQENENDLQYFTIYDSDKKEVKYDTNNGEWMLSKDQMYYIVVAARGTLKIGFQWATSHVHQGVWQTITEATCGQNGLAVEICGICGEKLSEKMLPATGNHTYTTTVVDQPAACTTAGSQHRECSVCGQHETATVIPAKGHTLVTKVDKSATCGAAGSQHKECTVCGYKEAATVIPATGAHKYVTKIDKAATCGAAGSKHKECTVCGYKEIATAIPATGAHKYVTKIDKAATCGAAGSKHEECSVCGVKKAAVAIPATGAHKFGAYKTTVSATVMKAGTKVSTCSVCGEERTQTIKKLTPTIKVAKKSVTVNVGSSVQAPKVTFRTGDAIKSWKAKDSKIASVDKNGKIIGKKAGKTTVMVTLKSGKIAKITVTVKKIATTKVTVDQKKVILKKGKTCQLKATVTPVNSQDKVTYKSSDSKIASVDKNGKITAKKKGKATITITSGKKKTTCKVTVK